MAIKHIDVFDCDGVLLCSMHRYRTMPCNTRIDLEHWRENSTPEQIWNDKPLPMAEYYQMCLENPEHYVIIATARQCQQADLDVIEFKLGKPDKIIYRGQNDNRGGVQLKMDGLKKLINLRQFKNAAWTIFEDNKTYLEGIVQQLTLRNCRVDSVFVPSAQGH